MEEVHSRVAAASKGSMQIFNEESRVAEEARVLEEEVEAARAAFLATIQAEYPDICLKHTDVRIAEVITEEGTDTETVYAERFKFTEPAMAGVGYAIDQAVLGGRGLMVVVLAIRARRAAHTHAAAVPLSTPP